MNLIGLIISIALLAVLGGGYVVTHKTGGDTMKDVATAGNDAIEKAKDVVADVNEKDEKRMLEDKMNDDGVLKKDEVMMKKEEPVKGKVLIDDKKIMTDVSAVVTHGSYEVYAAEKLSNADTGKVVLFFRAPWCPSCKTVDADIRAHAMTIPKGVTILDVDYDTSAVLKTKYGVTYQHTFVQVDAKGNQLVKWSGSPTLADIVTKLK